MNVLLYLSLETLIGTRRGIFVEIERGAVVDAGGASPRHSSRFLVGTACSGSVWDDFFFVFGF